MHKAYDRQSKAVVQPFVEKYIGTVHFGNDEFALILCYGYLVQVAFKKSTCFVRDLQGNDLLTGNLGSDLYTISLQETSSSTLICFMAKVSPIQAWLWHRRLSHLNFDYINLLSRKDVVIGLPKLKYLKDQLFSSCEVSKAKRSSLTTKAVPSSKGQLNLLHMDLCGPMRVASTNGKKYILATISMRKHINDEEHIFVTLLILVLALLFCPILAKEELWARKKYADEGHAGKGPSLIGPFRPVVGEEGFEPSTPWFVATSSNPLSYRPHSVSTGFVPGSTLTKGTFALPSHFRGREPVAVSAVLPEALGSRNRRALILGFAYYLDAFNSYPLHTWLHNVYCGHDNWCTRATALPLGTVRSLRPTFVPARRVGLAVKLPSAFALEGQSPSGPRKPLHTSKEAFFAFHLSYAGKAQSQTQGTVKLHRVFLSRFDEIKEMFETSVDNNTSGLVRQRQKASDYDNSGLVPQLQNFSPSADTATPSQQDLDLFGPLYNEIFNACTSSVNKSSSPTDNSKQQDTPPTTNNPSLTEPTTPTTNVHTKENNDNQAEDTQFQQHEFINPFCIS
nr:hypothetical protein [Tanacetum cinerariifolium]